MNFFKVCLSLSLVVETTKQVLSLIFSCLSLLISVFAMLNEQVCCQHTFLKGEHIFITDLGVMGVEGLQ